ncbi:MAG: hypothetical protein K6T28_00375 [Acidothermus sp.]|nr:hypothetical protein [Acidothermus sp.]
MSVPSLALAEPSVRGLHRIAIPDCEPPFDDETEDDDAPAALLASVSSNKQSLALEFPGALPAPRRHLRLVRTGDMSRDSATAADEHPRITAEWVARFVQAVGEVVTGLRPATQLIRWTTLEVLEALRHRAAAAARPVGLRRTAEESRPTRVMLKSLRMSEPIPGIAEVCAVVLHGPRYRAMALRFEGADGRWRCTAFQLG